MQILIVGPGLVGTALAADMLVQAGYPSMWRHRRGFCIEPRQVKLTSGEKIELTPRLPEAQKVAVDLVFVTTRAADVITALREIPQYTHRGAIIVTFNNGYRVDEIDRVGKAELSGYDLRIGMTSLSAVKQARYWELTNLAPLTVFGPLEPRRPTAVEGQFCQAYPRAHFVEQPLPYVRKKWLFNVVINGLCGLYLLPKNGDLLKHEHDVHAVLAEAYQWAERHWGAWQWSLDQLRQETWELIRLTAENQNSMVRDLRAGRRTEMPYLAGLVDETDHSCPWLQRLRRLNGNLS